MPQLSYSKSRNHLVDNYKKSLNVKEDENLNGQLNMVSAGLVNYLPDIAVEQHEEIFKDILLHKKLSILEQSTYEVLDHVTMENLSPETMDLLKNKPGIICTFHTGSYRLLNLFLTSNKIPYTLVIGNDIVQQEGSVFETLYSKLPGSDDGFKIINAEAANVGLQMLRELKRGRSLLLYMDGNTGAGAATTKNDNRCAINFLQQQIYARKGIAFLAHTAGVPIVTVASYRKTWEDIRLKFFDPIFPDASADRNVFAEQTTQKIYNLVAPIIKTYPGQWEAWLYIHKVAHVIRPVSNTQQKRSDSVSSEKISFDSFQFGIFKLKGSPFLLRKSTYSFFEINNQLYDFLKGCKDAPVKKDCIEESLFKKLYEQGVISYV